MINTKIRNEVLFIAGKESIKLQTVCWKCSKTKGTRGAIFKAGSGAKDRGLGS